MNEEELDMFMWVDILVDPYDYDVLQQIRQKIHDLGLLIIVIQYNQNFKPIIPTEIAVEGDVDENNSEEHMSNESNDIEGLEGSQTGFGDITAEDDELVQRQMLLQQSLSTFLKANATFGYLQSVFEKSEMADVDNAVSNASSDEEHSGLTDSEEKTIEQQAEEMYNKLRMLRDQKINPFHLCLSGFLDMSDQTQTIF